MIFPRPGSSAGSVVVVVQSLAELVRTVAAEPLAKHNRYGKLAMCRHLLSGQLHLPAATSPDARLVDKTKTARRSGLVRLTHRGSCG